MLRIDDWPLSLRPVMWPFFLSCLLIAALIWSVANLDRLPSSAYRASKKFDESVSAYLPYRPATQAEHDVLFELWNRGSISGKIRFLPTEFFFSTFKHDPHVPSGVTLRLISGTLMVGSLAFIIHIVLWGRFLYEVPPNRERYQRCAATVNICLVCGIAHAPLVLVTLDFYSHVFSCTVFGRLYLTPIAVSNTTLVTVAALSFVTYPLVVFHRRWQQRLRSTNPTHCPNCNYERGTLDTCPECGTPRSAASTRLSKAKRRTLIAGYAAIPILLIAPFWISWIDIAIYHLTN